MINSGNEVHYTVHMYRVAQKKRTPLRGSGEFPDFWLFTKYVINLSLLKPTPKFGKHLIH